MVRKLKRAGRKVGGRVIVLKRAQQLLINTCLGEWVIPRIQTSRDVIDLTTVTSVLYC